MSRPHRTSDAASDQARWQEICRLFDEALDRDPEEREAWLRRECRTDPSLLAEVRGMLAGHERSEGVLDAPPTAALGGILDRLEGTAAPARGTTSGPGPGETVGHYRIVRLVGRGGMGVVYQAWDPRLDRQVALKLLPASADADEGARARLLQEARRASALDHPNICTVYDVGPADGGALYIAMAYYAGGTVADRIAKGPLPVDEAVDLARQVLEGLDRAHEAGIVHRDVKPSNLAVTTRGEAKILDFGIACLAGAATTDGGPRRGTVGYMAPEQIAGAAIDQRVDLWALGVVLHEMLAGRPLFHGPDLHVVLDRVLHAAIPSLSALRPDVPAALEGIVRAALVRDPAGRYPSAARFLADLEQFRSGTPPRPVSVPGRYQEAVVPGAVPRPISSLVGREAEIEALVELLGSARLVTVTGPGGVGKTRLAIETASRCVASSRDVSFVRLASVSSPDDVPLAIARSLGLVESPYRPLRETLRDALRDREALIVLDNFERVLDSAPVVLEILESSPGSRILVTSRGPLRLQGEHVFPVHPLGLPRRGAESSAARLLESPAVRLFVERATAADPGFTFDDDVAGTVAEICRRLDGIPLAIELAATRVGLLPPVALLHRLEKRLDVVGGRGRDLPDRHRTLEAAISWSVELLSEAERALFRRLSVFPGGARPGTMKKVVAAPGPPHVDLLEGLEALAGQSLVFTDLDPGGEPRFRMLWTIREFAARQLQQAGEVGPASRALALSLLELAERARPHLTREDQALWLDRLDRERDNLAAALHWALDESEAEIAVRLSAALWRWWLGRGQLREGRVLIERALELSDDRPDTPERAEALYGLSTLLHYLGDKTLPRTHLDEALRIWRTRGDSEGISTVLHTLGWIYVLTGEIGAAEAVSQEALALTRAGGDARGTALALNNLGWAACYRGDPVRARAYLEESVALERRSRDRRGTARGLTNLAWAAQLHGDLVDARGLLEESRAILEELRDPNILAWNDVIGALVELDDGKLVEARQRLDRSVGLWREGGYRAGLAWTFTLLGRALTDAGELDSALEHLQRGLRLWEEVGNPWGIGWGLAETGRLDLAAGRTDEAGATLEEALRHLSRVGAGFNRARCLETLARVRATRGDPAGATRRLGEASALRDRLAIRPPRRRDDHDRLLAELREALGPDAFESHWRSGREAAET